MKVPEYVRRKMHRLADLQSKATVLSREIDDWFMKNGFDIEELRCGDGCSLEELDYGNDITDEFCDRIENGEFGGAENDR